MHQTLLVQRQCSGIDVEDVSRQRPLIGSIFLWISVMRRYVVSGLLALTAAFTASIGSAAPFPPVWDGGDGAAIHHAPVAWPVEPADLRNCTENCGDWKPYTRFQQSMKDPRNRDPSNGGTAPQSYVNVSSSCVDTALPSIYYYLLPA